MAAAASSSRGSPTFDGMATKLVTRHNLKPDRKQDSVRLAYIVQVLLNVLTELSDQAEDTSVDKTIAKEKGNDFIKKMQELGILQPYSVLAGPVTDDGGRAMVRGRAMDGGVAAALKTRTATEEGRDVAERVGRYLDPTTLNEYRRDALGVLVDLHNAAINGVPFVIPSYPPSSSDMVHSFAASIMTVGNDEREYIRGSTMTLIVHVLDKMGRISLLNPTKSAQQSILEFFKNRGIALAVGGICMATPYIVTWFLGLPIPSLNTIWAAIGTDYGRFLAGSTAANVFLNRDEIYSIMKNGYSSVFSSVFGGGVVDPEVPGQVVAVGRAAAGDGAAAPPPPPPPAAAAAEDPIRVLPTIANGIKYKLTKTISKTPNDMRRDRRLRTIIRNLDRQIKTMTVEDMNYLNNHVLPYKSRHGNNKLTREYLETGYKPAGSRKTRKARGNKKHSKTRKARKSRGNNTHRVRKYVNRSSGKKSRRK
jgi:hypothetical protein